jgi:hypothetical protein
MGGAYSAHGERRGVYRVLVENRNERDHLGTLPFLGVKRLKRDTEHQTPSSAEVKERIDLYLYSNSGPSWPATG